MGLIVLGPQFCMHGVLQIGGPCAFQPAGSLVGFIFRHAQMRNLWLAPSHLFFFLLAVLDTTLIVDL